MTSTELIQKAIRYEPVPRMPVAVLDGYNWFFRHSDMSEQALYALPSREAAAFLLKQYERVGSDLTYVGPLAGVAVRELLAARTGRSPVFSAPEEATRFSPEELCREAESHPLLGVLAGLLEEMNRQLNGEKPILAFGAGPLTSAAGYLGMEDLMMALTEDPDSVEILLDFCTDVTIRLLRFQVEHGATGISIADPVSAVNLISEPFFLRFSLPRIRRITGAFRGSGLPIMLHICGNSAPRIAPLRDSGIHIYSMDTVDLGWAQKEAEGAFAIFGNLNTVSVMLESSPEQVYAQARDLCLAAPTGFILAPGCDLPPDTPEENIRAMIRAARSV